MRQVSDWSPVLVDLMEDVVAEELDQVAVACLCPSRVVVEFWTLVDEAELRDQAEEATSL